MNYNVDQQEKDITNWVIFLLVVFMGLLIFVTVLTRAKNTEMRQQIIETWQLIEYYETENAVLYAELEESQWEAQIWMDRYYEYQRTVQDIEDENMYLRWREATINERMRLWLDAWEVDIWEGTAYAPLDSRAVEGMCYQGDPSITASGAPVIPYLTAAAGPDIEFGTQVYVVGDGPRVISDRGARVGSRRIDLAMETREEALKFGRQPVKVVYQR